MKEKNNQTTNFMNIKDRNACFKPENSCFLEKFQIGLYVRGQLKNHRSDRIAYFLKKKKCDWEMHDR